MKKLIVCLSLAAFALVPTLQAGEECCATTKAAAAKTSECSAEAKATVAKVACAMEAKMEAKAGCCAAKSVAAKRAALRARFALKGGPLLVRL